MTDLAKFDIDSAPAVDSITRLEGKLDSLDDRMAKVSRTGTRNSTLLRKAFEESTNGVIAAINGQTQALDRMAENIVNDLRKSNTAITESTKVARDAKNAALQIEKEMEAMWSKSLADKKAVEEGKVALAELSTTKQVAALRAQQLQETKVASEMEAMWVKVAAHKKAIEEGKVLLAQQSAAKIAAINITSAAAEKALLGTASHYGGPLAGTPMQASTVAALNKELAKTPNLMDKGKQATTNLSGGFKQLALDGNDVHSAMRGLASGFGLLWLTWGNLLPLFAGAAISNGVKQVVALGAQVQQTMETIRVLSEESASSVKGLSTQMLELARVGPFGPLEVAKAMKLLSLAGLEAGQVSTSIKDVLNFAVAGDTSIEKAADVMTTVATAFSIAAEGYNYIGDVIAKTAAVSKSSVESIGEAFKTASVINKQYGVSLEDVGVGLAALSNLGIQGSAAGTALRNMYKDLSGRSKESVAILKQYNLELRDSAGGFLDLITITQRLSGVINEFDSNIAKKDFLKKVLSERGAKPIIELLDLTQREAAKTGDTVQSELEKLKQKIVDSAGFVVIAAAQMSLTPMNQMKSVLSNLQASFVETFNGLEPVILNISSKLKDMFGTDEFKNSLQNIVIGVARLTMAFVEHIDVIGKLTIAYLAFKAAQMTSGFFKALAAEAAIASTALAGTATATAAASTAATASAAAATAATAASAGWLSRAVGLGGKVIGFLGPIGAALALGATAWQLYDFFAGKSSTTLGNLATSTYSEELIKKLKEETLRLNENTEALRLNISVQELRVQKAAKDSKATILEADSAKTAAATREVLLAEKELNRLEENARKSEFKSPMVEVQKEKVRLAKEELATLVKKQEITAKDLMYAEIFTRVAAENNKTAIKDKMEAEKKAAASLLGNTPFGTPDKSHLAAFKVEQDQETEILTRALADQGRLLDLQYTNELARLSSKNSNKLLSDGEYFNQAYTLAKSHESKKLAFLEEAAQQRTAAYLIDVTQVTEQYTKEDAAAKKHFTDSSKYTASQEAAIKSARQTMVTYTGSFEKWMLDNDLAKEKVKENAFTLIAKSLDKLLGALHNIKKAYDEFNISEQQHLDKINRQIGLEDQMRYASPEARAWLAATSAEEERLVNTIDKLEKGLREANQAALDLEGNATFDIFDTENGPAFLAALEKRNKLEQELINIKNGVGAKVTEAGARALSKLAKDNAEVFSNGLADSIETAVFEGGKAGGDKFWKVLQDEFLRKPLRVFLQGVMGSVVGGAMGSAAGGVAGSMGLSALGAAAGSYAGSALGLTGAGSIASGWSGAAAAAGSADMITGGIYTATTAMEGLGASIYGLFSAIPVWGWAAMAALAVFGGSGKNIPKSEGGFAPNGMNISGLDALGNQQGSQRGDTAAAQLISSSIVLGYQTVAQQLGIKNGKIDVGVFYAQDPTGDSQTQLQVIGGAYNRSSVMGGIENAGTSSADLQSAIALSAAQLVLVNLQASDLPAYLKRVFNGLSADTATAQQINDAVAFATSLRQIYTSLTETRTPLQMLADDLLTFGTTTATYQADFAHVIEGGLNAADVTAWQNLGAEIANVNSIVAKTTDLKIAEAKAMGDTAGAAALLTTKREAEYTALGATDGPIQRHIDQLNDQKVADKVVSDHNRAMLNAAGDTSGLAAFDQAVADAALITAGWTQAQVDAVHTAEASAKTATATSAFDRAMLNAAGNTSGLAAFDQAVSDAALITAGWTQAQVDAVHTAEASAKTATATSAFDRAMLNAAGDTSGLAKFDQAVADAALITAGWTQAQVDAVHTAEASAKTATATSAFDRAMLNATGNTSGLAKFDQAVADTALRLSGWSEKQIADVHTAEASAKTAKITSDFDRAMLSAAGDTSGLAKFDQAIADAALIAAGWTKAQVDQVNAMKSATQAAIDWSAQLAYNAQVDANAQAIRDRAKDAIGTFVNKFDSASSAQEVADAQAFINETLTSLGLSINMTAQDIANYLKTIQSNSYSAEGIFAVLPELTAAFDTLATSLENVRTAYSNYQSALTSVGNAVEDLHDKQIAAQQKVNDLTKTAADNLYKFAGTIGDFLDTITPEKTGSLASLKAQFSATAVLAAGGDTVAQGKLITQAQAVLKAAEAGSTSALEYARSEAFVRNTLKPIQEKATTQSANLLATLTTTVNTAGLDIAHSLGLTGSAADKLATLLHNTGTASTTLATLLSKPGTASTTLATMLDLSGTQAKNFTDQLGSSSTAAKLLTGNFGDADSGLTKAIQDSMVAQVNYSAALIATTDLEWATTDALTPLNIALAAYDTATRELGIAALAAAAGLDKATPLATALGLAGPAADAFTAAALAAAAALSGLLSGTGTRSASSATASAAAFYHNNPVAAAYHPAGGDKAGIDYWAAQITATNLSDAYASFSGTANAIAANDFYSNNATAMDYHPTGPDQAGVDYWASQIASLGLDKAKSDFDLSVAAYAAAHPLTGYATGTNYLQQDGAFYGHQGETITPKSYVDIESNSRKETNALIARLLASNERLEKKVEALQKPTEATASATERTKDVTEQVAFGGYSYQTRAQGT